VGVAMIYLLALALVAAVFALALDSRRREDWWR